MAKKKQSFAARSTQILCKSIKSFDSFGKGVSFEIDGDSVKRSYLGAFFSIGIIVLTLSYAQNRYMSMIEYGNSSYQSTENDNVTDIENQLTHENTGLDIAIGLFKNGEWNPHYIDPTGYIQIGFSIVEWDMSRKEEMRKFMP